MSGGQAPVLEAVTAVRRQARDAVLERLLEFISQNEESYQLIMKERDEEGQRQAIVALAERGLGHIRLPEGVLLSRSLKTEIVEALCNEILGYGPIAPLIRDPRINEIMVNGPDKVFVEKDGVVREAAVRFRNVEHLRAIIQKIVWRLGRRIDETSPLVDARLPDGSRVNAAFCPVALTGPYLTIRKFPDCCTSFEDLVLRGTLSAPMADFLTLAVKVRMNIIVSGGTSSGKTTMLNVLASVTPPDERIITVEDAAELHLTETHRNVCAFEAKPVNVEGRGAITIRDLVRNALRMRPDRLIVGEVRGPEALDMLQAMNTGHDGSFTTAHANSAQDLFSRLETMVCMASTELPVSAIMDIIVAALHLIVHVHRFPDGVRRVAEIMEVTGVGVDGRIVATPIWTLHFRHEPGHQPEPRFRFHGLSSRSRVRFEEFEIAIPGAAAAESCPRASSIGPSDRLVDDLLGRLAREG